jgi:hypothetical protein
MAITPLVSTQQETIMDIVIAAEKPSIAGILSDYLRHKVRPQEIEVHANPNETGSFLVNWQLNHYILSPSGDLELRAIRQS